MGPLGELGALFNPGMRHEMEEKRAKQMLREEEGTGRKGRLGIDLDSGVAVIGGDDIGDDDGSVRQRAAREPEQDERPDAPETGSRAESSNAESTVPPAVPPTRTANAARSATTARPRGKRRAATADAPRAAPGEPQQAARPASAVPSGKARRRSAR